MCRPRRSVATASADGWRHVVRTVPNRRVAGGIKLSMRITVYSTTYCGYCRAAEALLKRKGIEFELIDVTSNPAERARLLQRAHGRRTVPVIFLDDEAIGGYAELKCMDATGELDHRLGRPRAA
jgi:glutaredoxin 3